jgi:uncharacterized membrane protein
MEDTQPTGPHSPRLGRWTAVVAGLVLGAYLALTPGGFLTKADMVGYAVCHQIPSHSYFVAGRQLPLCARCSGTFLGALTGLFGQAIVLSRRRHSDLPPAVVTLFLLLFFGAWGFDGLNSYLNMIELPHLYTPHHWLRTTTGALTGLSISALLFPIFNLSVWKRPSPEPAIQNLRDLGILVLMEIGLVLLIFSRWSPFLYPLALLSGIGVLTMLTVVNSVLVMMALRWENRYRNLQEAVPPLLLGFSLALFQVGAIDIMRYLVTGTLDGFPGLS